MIVIAGHFDVRRDKQAEFAEAAKEVSEATRLEDGCQFYEFWQDLDAGGRYALLEAWDSQAALEAHLVAPHVQKFGAKDLGMENQQVFAYEIANTKRLSD